jgi:hypothetical protein
MSTKDDITTLEQQLKDTPIHECEVYSRIVGYFRPVKQWNTGKQEEYKDRKTFDASLKIEERG